MRPQDQEPERAEQKPKAPYQRPKLTQVGTLRDVTAQMTPVFPPSPPP